VNEFIPTLTHVPPLKHGLEEQALLPAGAWVSQFLPVTPATQWH